MHNTVYILTFLNLKGLSLSDALCYYQINYLLKMLLRHHKINTKSRLISLLGTESSLGDCANNGPGVHNCCHVEDAGVRCSIDAADASSTSATTASTATSGTTSGSTASPDTNETGNTYQSNYS